MHNGTAHLCVLQSKAQRGQHRKGKQRNVLRHFYCNDKHIFFINSTFLQSSKIHFCSSKQMFFLKIDSNVIINCDTLSVAPSTINDSVKSLLFHSVQFLVDAFASYLSQQISVKINLSKKYQKQKCFKEQNWELLNQHIVHHLGYGNTFLVTPQTYKFN